MILERAEHNEEMEPPKSISSKFQWNFFFKQKRDQLPNLKFRLSLMTASFWKLFDCCSKEHITRLEPNVDRRFGEPQQPGGMSRVSHS